MKNRKLISLPLNSLFVLRAKRNLLSILLRVIVTLVFVLPRIMSTAAAQPAFLQVVASNPPGTISNGQGYHVGTIDLGYSQPRFDFTLFNYDGLSYVTIASVTFYELDMPSGIHWQIDDSCAPRTLGGQGGNCPFSFTLYGDEAGFDNGAFSGEIEVEYTTGGDRYEYFTFGIIGTIVGPEERISVHALNPPKLIRDGDEYVVGDMLSTQTPHSFQFELVNDGFSTVEDIAVRMVVAEKPSGVVAALGDGCTGNAALVPGGYCGFEITIDAADNSHGELLIDVIIDYGDNSFSFTIAGYIVGATFAVEGISPVQQQIFDGSPYLAGPIHLNELPFKFEFAIANQGLDALEVSNFEVSGFAGPDGASLEISEEPNVIPAGARGSFYATLSSLGQETGAFNARVSFDYEDGAVPKSFSFTVNGEIIRSTAGCRSGDCLDIEIRSSSGEILSADSKYQIDNVGPIEWVPDQNAPPENVTAVFTVTNRGTQEVKIISFDVKPTLVNAGDPQAPQNNYNPFVFPGPGLTIPTGDNNTAEFSIELQDDVPGDYEGKVEIVFGDKPTETIVETYGFIVTGSVGTEPKLRVELFDWFGTDNVNVGPDLNNLEVSFDFDPDQPVVLSFVITNEGERPLVIHNYKGDGSNGPDPIGTGYILEPPPKTNTLIGTIKDGYLSHENVSLQEEFEIAFFPDLITRPDKPPIGEFWLKTNDLTNRKFPITLVAHQRPPDQAANVLDGYTNKSPDRLAGMPLNGTISEKGNRTWTAYNTVVFGTNVITNNNGATGGSHIAGVPFTVANQYIATVSADIKVTGSQWIGIGFSKSADGGYWGDGQGWALVKPNGGMEIWANGTKHYLGGPVAPNFKANDWNALTVQYDASDNSLSVSVNGTKVLDKRDLNAFGFKPDIRYAGFHMYNGNLNTQGQMMIDNFQANLQRKTIPFEADPPRSWVGKPDHNETLSGVAALYGWAMDASGVSSVSFKLDGQPITLQDFLYGTSRDGVCQENSDLKDPNCPNVGWAGTLDTRSYSNGAHTLQMLARDVHGNQKPFDRQFNINNQTAANGIIQDGFTNSSPNRDPGDPLHGTKTEVGNATWVAYNTVIFGVNTITNKNGTAGSYVGGVPFNPAQYPDKPIATVSADVKVTGSQWIGIGFSKSATGGYWSDGQAWMLLKPNGGMEIWANGTKHFLGGPQAPQFNATGFNALAMQYNSAENTVSAAVNGVVVLDKRDLDVFGFKPDIRYAGFHMYNGSMGTQGQMQIDNFSVRVDKADTPPESTRPKIWIGRPALNEAVAGTIAAYGWAMDASGVAHVSFQMDGQPLTLQNFVYGTPRQGVCDFYSTIKDPNCPNVGWGGNLDTKKFANGTHTLRMLAKDAHGNQETLDQRFVINNPPSETDPPRSWVGKPWQNETLSGVVVLYGWATDASGVSSVSFKLDGQPITLQDLYYGLSRDDVCQVHGDLNDPNCPNVGWAGTLDTRNYSNGTHTLQMLARDVHGNQKPFDRLFVIDNKIVTYVKMNDVITMKSYHNRYLVAESNGQLNANRTQIDSQTKFSILDPNNLNSTRQIYYGDVIALRAFNGKYVVAENDGMANANRNAIGPWEMWILVNPENPNDRSSVVNDGKIAMRSWQNLYLVAEYDYTVNANRTDALAWETWTLNAASLAKAGNASDAQIDEPASLPNDYSLGQNYPNPFNPTTTIRYGLPKDGHVTLKIYNLTGQEVRTLLDGVQSAGLRSLTWDGKDNLGQQVPSGVYLYRIVSGEFKETKRMVLMR